MSEGTFEEILAHPEIAGFSIWQFTDCKTYTRTKGMRNRSYGVNTVGLYDLYRRPKMAVEEMNRVQKGRRAGLAQYAEIAGRDAEAGLERAREVGHVGEAAGARHGAGGLL